MAAAILDRGLGDFGSIEQDLAAGDHRLGRKDAQGRLADHGLSRAGFPDQSQYLTGPQRKRDVAQYRREAPILTDGEVEIAYIENSGHLRKTGSKVVRSPSPRALKPSTANTMHAIGNAIIQFVWLM